MGIRVWGLGVTVSCLVGAFGGLADSSIIEIKLSYSRYRSYGRLGLVFETRTPQKAGGLTQTL